MNILFRYIAANFIRFFAVCIFSFLVLYLTIDFMGQFWRLSARGIPYPDIARYFLYKSPHILTQISPMATLLATMLTLGILSRNSEITVMKSCGISIFYISLPILDLALLISLFSLATNELVVPRTNKAYRAIERYRPGVKSFQRLYKKDRLWYFGRENIFNIDLLDTEHKVLRGVTILQTDGTFKIIRRIDAGSALWEGGRWIFSNGVIRGFNDSVTVERFGKKEIAIEERFDDFMVVAQTSEEMSLDEMRIHIDKLRNMGLDYNKYLVDLLAKVAFPLVNFILPLIGIPFSLKTGRSSGIAAGVGISIVIGFTYWVAMAFSISLGHAGVLPPFLAAFGANLLFGVVGMIFLLRIRS